ncbi:MAG TPA: Mpo1-like protein [Usitatibacter sp.]|jgi:uncharacterized membrane protein YGL010W|nr:Mpo1-like protein [Usitatibacter sp.]
MGSLEKNLVRYAACHRDRRNLATHFAGIPMIVLAVVIALATASVRLGSFEVTLAAIASVVACIYYFRLDFLFGLTMAVVLFAACAAASEILARLGPAGGLAAAAALFAVGWALQFLGHRFEGLKPAFFDDVRQLLIGPLFLCAEAYFFLGAKPKLRRHVEERVGPVVARRTPGAASASRT